MSITFILPGVATADGATYIGRNSYHPANDAWIVRNIDAVTGDPESFLECQHVTLAQVADRNGCMLAGPWWNWGGEIGSNDKGLVVAFEIALTKEHENEPGLTGYELVRLVLERSSDVAEALDVLTWLIQKYGQGGTGTGQLGELVGDSCFVIGDHQEFWLVETAGRQWAARKINGPQVLGARLIIDERHKYASYSLVQYAQARRIISAGSSQIDFAAAFARGPKRVAYFRAMEKRLQLAITSDTPEQQVLEMMNVLRTRREDSPSKSSAGDIALHARPRQPAQTTGAMVMRLSTKRIEHFTTGAAAPDLIVFKPLGTGHLLDRPLDGQDLATYNGESYWWRTALLHRKLIALSDLDASFFVERNALETDMVQTIIKSKASDQPAQIAKQQKYLLEWEAEWLTKLAARPTTSPYLSLFANYWQKLNNQAALPE